MLAGIAAIVVAPHELLVFKSDLDPSAFPTDAAGDIKEKGAGVILVSDGDNIDPAASRPGGDRGSYQPADPKWIRWFFCRAGGLLLKLAILDGSMNEKCVSAASIIAGL